MSGPHFQIPNSTFVIHSYDVGIIADMRVSLRIQILALLTAIALIGGSLAQPIWLWQCRHASVAVAAPISTAQMPCRMAGADMSTMACCRHMASSTSTCTTRLQAPPCSPQLRIVDAASPARLDRPSPLHIGAVDISTSPVPALVIDTVSCPQFRAPSIPSPPSLDRWSSPSLRAPPV